MSGDAIPPTGAARAVYVLYHFCIEACSDQDYEENDMKLVGIYATEERALAAVATLRDAPGFRDWPGGFRVYDARLDHTSWTGGFCDPYADDPAGA